MDEIDGIPARIAAEVPDLRQAAFIGVGAMVGAGIFALLGAAGEIAGAAVWLSFLIAGVIAGFRATPSPSSAPGTRRPGGLLEYVASGFGDGHITGITAWLRPWRTPS